MPFTVVASDIAPGISSVELVRLLMGLYVVVVVVAIAVGVAARLSKTPLPGPLALAASLVPLLGFWVSTWTTKCTKGMLGITSCERLAPDWVGPTLAVITFSVALILLVAAVRTIRSRRTLQPH